MPARLPAATTGNHADSRVTWAERCGHVHSPSPHRSASRWAAVARYCQKRPPDPEQTPEAVPARQPGRAGVRQIQVNVVWNRPFLSLQETALREFCQVSRGETRQISRSAACKFIHAGLKTSWSVWSSYRIPSYMDPHSDPNFI